MRSLALLLALMAVIVSSGCVSSSVMDMEITQIARTSEAIDQFLAEHPNAEISIQLVKEDSLSADSDFSSKCTSITASDLYKVDITDSESGTEAWAFVDANGTVVCAYAEGSQTDGQPTPTTPQTGNGNGGQNQDFSVLPGSPTCVNVGGDNKITVVIENTGTTPINPSSFTQATVDDTDVSLNLSGTVNPGEENAAPILKRYDCSNADNGGCETGQHNITLSTKSGTVKRTVICP